MKSFRHKHPPVERSRTLSRRFDDLSSFSAFYTPDVRLRHRRDGDAPGEGPPELLKRLRNPRRAHHIDAYTARGLECGRATEAFECRIHEAAGRGAAHRMSRKVAGRERERTVVGDRIERKPEEIHLSHQLASQAEIEV